MLRPSGVSSASDASCAASANVGKSTPSTGVNSTACRLPSVIVPVLSKQQHVDVARGFDGPADGGNHVGLNHAVHAGNADGREQSADRGGNQADQQRHQHRDGNRGPLPCRLHAVQRKRQQRHASQQEDNRQRREQNVQGDFVGRLLPLGPFDQGDHAIEERLAGIGADAHDQPVGEDARAAGNAAAVAAAFANHGRAFAGDRAFVDRGDPFQHFAVGRNLIARLDQ